jgi:hypothetical protein
MVRWLGSATRWNRFLVAAFATRPDKPLGAQWRSFCIDNTLAADVLVVGAIYEVMHINERDGLYALSGLGRSTMARFEVVSAAEAGDWPSRRIPPKN